jgi:hypothetical protein
MLRPSYCCGGSGLVPLVEPLPLPEQGQLQSVAGGCSMTTTAGSRCWAYSDVPMMTMKTETAVISRPRKIMSLRPVVTRPSNLRPLRECLSLGIVLIGVVNRR